MCCESVVENGGTLKFVLDNCKNQKLSNKCVLNDADALEYVPDCFKTQKCVIKLLMIFHQH